MSKMVPVFLTGHRVMQHYTTNVSRNKQTSGIGYIILSSLSIVILLLLVENGKWVIHTIKRQHSN